MTGAIGDRLLDAKAQAIVAELLAADLSASGHLSHRTSLEEVASWPDEIRGSPASRPKWHFDKLAACSGDTQTFACPGKQCNTMQIAERLAVLKNPNEAPRNRNEALKWIVHLVGDIHQPLHAAENRDTGGNAVKVKLVNLPIDEEPRDLVLHHAWDRQFVLLAFNTGFSDVVPTNIVALALEARALLASIGLGTPMSWALESNVLARDAAYHYDGFTCNHTSRRRVALDAEYQQAAAAVVRVRVLLGGARLAQILNETIGNGP